MSRQHSKLPGPRAEASSLTDREIWTGAINMIRRYGHEAASEARQRLDIFVCEDELDAQLSWLKVIEAIAWLQDDQPRRPRVIH
jgi:hypothetical protein